MLRIDVQFECFLGGRSRTVQPIICSFILIGLLGVNRFFLDRGDQSLRLVFALLDFVHLGNERVQQLPRLQVAAPYFLRLKEVVKMALTEVEIGVFLLIVIHVVDPVLRFVNRLIVLK